MGVPPANLSPHPIRILLQQLHPNPPRRRHKSDPHPRPDFVRLRSKLRPLSPQIRRCRIQILYPQPERTGL